MMGGQKERRGREKRAIRARKGREKGRIVSPSPYTSQINVGRFEDKNRESTTLEEARVDFKPLSPSSSSTSQPKVRFSSLRGR